MVRKVLFHSGCHCIVLLGQLALILPTYSGFSRSKMDSISHCVFETHTCPYLLLALEFTGFLEVAGSLRATWEQMRKRRPRGEGTLPGLHEQVKGSWLLGRGLGGMPPPMMKDGDLAPWHRKELEPRHVFFLRVTPSPVQTEPHPEEWAISQYS